METGYTEVPETSAKMLKVMSKVTEQQAQTIIGASMIYPLSAIKQEPIFTLREDTTTLHPYNPYHVKHDPVDILMTSWIKQEPGLSDSMETTNPSISIGGLHENDETNARTVGWRCEQGDGAMSAVLLVPDKPEVVSDLDKIKVETSFSADTLESHGFEPNGQCCDMGDPPLPVAMFANEINSEGRVGEKRTEDLEDGASHGGVSVRGMEGPIYKDSERIWKDEKLLPVVTVSTSTDEDTLSILPHDTDNIHRYGTTHAREKSYICSACDYGTEQRSNLGDHVCSDKQHVCPQCDYKTDVRLNLLTHLRTHTGDEQYKCNYCKYRSGDKDKYVAHWVLHTLEEKPYKCSLCDDTFAKKCDLNYHSTSTHGDKPYSCSMCAYSGSCNANLILHMRKHTGEKPYCCNKCEYKTSDQRSLKKHIEFHTVEKPYKCSRCNYACIYKSRLVVHTRTHTGETLYSCPICDFTASFKSNLDRHMRKHTGH